MNQSSLLLIGAGGHARACIDVVEQHGQFQIAGLVGMPSELHASHLGYTVIANDGDMEALSKQHPNALISLGQIQTPDHRMRLYRQAVGYGFQLPVIVSPRAYVSPHATLGAGTIVMHGAVVNAGAVVGENCIINSHALIEHDARVADHCHISTGTILNGGVYVGTGSFVGSGCVVKEGVRIGAGCIIGLGKSVRHAQADQTKFV